MTNIIKPQDAVVNAPPAEFGGNRSEKQLRAEIGSVLPGLDINVNDIVQWQAATIRRLEGDLEKTQIVSSTLCNVSLCLLKMLIDAGYSFDGESVSFPKELVDKMKGGSIAIKEEGTGDRTIRISTRSKYFFFDETED